MTPKVQANWRKSPDLPMNVGQTFSSAVGMRIRVTTRGGGDQKVAIFIEALDKNAKFEKRS